MSQPLNLRSLSSHTYVPKLVTILRGGYTQGDLRHDLTAGLTV
jgi:hypothetical protein